MSEEKVSLNYAQILAEQADAKKRAGETEAVAIPPADTYYVVKVFMDEPPIVAEFDTVGDVVEALRELRDMDANAQSEIRAFIFKGVRLLTTKGPFSSLIHPDGPNVMPPQRLYSMPTESNEIDYDGVMLGFTEAKPVVKAQLKAHIPDPEPADDDELTE